MFGPALCPNTKNGGRLKGLLSKQRIRNSLLKIKYMFDLVVYVYLCAKLFMYVFFAIHVSFHGQI